MLSTKTGLPILILPPVHRFIITIVATLVKTQLKSMQIYPYKAYSDEEAAMTVKFFPEMMQLDH